MTISSINKYETNKDIQHSQLTFNHAERNKKYYIKNKNDITILFSNLSRPLGIIKETRSPGNVVDFFPNLPSDLQLYT